MIQGINTAAAGMSSVIDWNDIIANNLANINTVGFKQLIPTFRDIKEINIQAENTAEPMNPGSGTIGSISAGSIIDMTHLDFSTGALKKTDRNLDVAINGDGFFAIQTAKGEFYTRNGNFTLDENRDLVTKSGDKVLSEGGGAINIDVTAQSMKELFISQDGRIMQGDIEIDKLRIVDFKDKSNLKTIGNSLFKSIDEQPVEMQNPSVSQGYLEGSNANVVKSMIDSITGSRTYETLSKIIRNSDSTLRKTINEVGRV